MKVVEAITPSGRVSVERNGATGVVVRITTPDEWATTLVFFCNKDDWERIVENFQRAIVMEARGDFAGKL